MADWPSDRVERRQVSTLVPYAQNARSHSDLQVSQLASSIQQWGWTTPVLIDEQGGIIAGHGRVLAANQLGIAEIPVMIASGWSASQKQAYVLADNQLSLNASWNDDQLTAELRTLSATSFDMSLIGFTPDDLTAIISGWESDIDLVARDGENTDGFLSTIRIDLESDVVAQAEAVIKAALDAAGITYDLR